jgi:glycosyltransferase involved in cell wall biosynthesis
MRIGVNLLPFRQQLAGAGRFAKNILENLVQLDRRNKYFLFVTESGKVNFRYGADNFTQITCPFLPDAILTRIFWEQLVLPWQLLNYRIDLLFTPSVAIPFFTHVKTVTVIHDMIPFHKSVAKYTRLRSSYIRSATAQAIRKSNRLIAVSETTKREMMRFCDVPADKISVCLEGVDQKYQKITSLSVIHEKRLKYNLPDKFILFVGTLEPGKNLFRLIEAFYQLKKENRITQKLVIVGAYGWGNGIRPAKTNEEVLQALPVAKDEIIFSGYVPDEDLPLIYNAADLFVFPSLYEGFGLPPLEAMACGTPVITSNLSSLPEIVGEAGLLIDPYNTKELADAIERVLKDNTLKQAMINKGFLQVKKFSWRSAAEIIHNVFHQIVGEN